jgi:hypothetical protein
MMDASIISAPRQRMNIQEKESVKQGEIPASWQAKPAKLAQKDLDARWVVKYSKSNTKEDPQAIDLAVACFGYKNHICIDREYGFVRRYQTTAANCYDGHLLSALIDPQNTDQQVWADTAYGSEQNKNILESRGLVSMINEKKPKNQPMPKQTLDSNRRKSLIRSKIEHVFAVQKTQMHLIIRSIGIKRAHVKLGLANIAYNMKRLVYWETKLQSPA